MTLNLWIGQLTLFETESAERWLNGLRFVLDDSCISLAELKALCWTVLCLTNVMFDVESLNWTTYFVWNRKCWMMIEWSEICLWRQLYFTRRTESTFCWTVLCLTNVMFYAESLNWTTYFVWNRKCWMIWDLSLTTVVFHSPNWKHFVELYYTWLM